MKLIYFRKTINLVLELDQHLLVLFVLLFLRFELITAVSSSD